MSNNPLGTSFAVRREQAKTRLDVNYNLLAAEVHRRLANPVYPLVSIRSLEVLLQYGCSYRASDLPSGFPILRMNNLQTHGWSLEDLKYVELKPEELVQWRLAPGDIVFNRTNSKELVGKCEVFAEEGDWVFASYLMRLRVNTEMVLPEFVAAFLNTAVGRVQIDRASRQIIGMSNINAEEIRSLLLPLPPLPVQRQLVDDYNQARGSRRAKLQQATELLTNLDDFLLRQLGLVAPEPSAAKHTTYAIRRSKVHEAQRLNAEYFHPERLAAIEAVKRGRDYRVRSLAAIADFRRDQRAVEQGDDYIGLAHVEPHTGERVLRPAEVGEGTCFVFRAGDILYGRLRPYLNKVYYAESPGVCSTEFHVIRVGSDRDLPVAPRYLATILRSQIVLSQTRHMMTGNTHPRIANSDVVNLLIPVPSQKVQERIVVEGRRRLSEARRMREDGERIWQTGKDNFERSLLGPAENQA